MWPRSSNPVLSWISHLLDKMEILFQNKKKNCLPVDLHMMVMRKDVGCVGSNDIVLHFLLMIMVCPENKQD